MPSNASASRATPFYGMQKQLEVEAAHKSLPLLLFCGYTVIDISAEKSERKTGTDFILELKKKDGTIVRIRCENKFEQYTSGRQLFELVSVDRPKIKAGWLYTSQAAWLLSWYPPTGELIAIPMDEARKLILENPARNKTTTTRNPSYLSWNALEDIKYVLRNTPNARILNLVKEIGAVTNPEREPMIGEEFADKSCTAEDLVALMESMPGESTPVPVADDELKAVMHKMAAKNMKKFDHNYMLAELPWLAPDKKLTLVKSLAPASTKPKSK